MSASSVFVFIGGVLTLLVAFFEQRTKGKSSPNWRKVRRNVPLLLLVAGLMGVVGAFWASLDQTRSEHEIASLNREILAQVTGGGSFCFLQLMPLDSRTARLSFIHQGDHPLYDLHAEIVDLDLMPPGGSSTLEFLTVGRHSIELSTLVPELATSLVQPWDFAGRKILRYNIFFTARNGAFNQQLQMRYINGEWLIAIRVFRKDQLIHESIDPRFPRNQKDDIDW